MVTSKEFHTSLVLLFISGIFSLLYSFSFVTNINGIPRAFGYLVLGSLFAYIFLLIATIRLRKVNKYFFYAFIVSIVNLVLSFLSLVFSVFDMIPIFDALEEGVDFSYFIFDILITVYIVIGLRDCYNKDEDVSKQMSHAFVYAILIASGINFILTVLSAFDALLKNYFFTLVMNMFSYLTGVGIAVILLVCYSRAMNISHKTLLAIKEREQNSGDLLEESKEMGELQDETK